ncbi:hypothetical protein HK099_004213 [Clydaea vesicula]|uniref:Uncharacterized protein n=1 Tax=Clydaea vesicula TaxID=447962 RepID=A0AAD5U0S0_9FUNG|nr:hypothetical protein HK099_004213 [Clydaea vesicula]
MFGDKKKINELTNQVKESKLKIDELLLDKKSLEIELEKNKEKLIKVEEDNKTIVKNNALLDEEFEAKVSQIENEFDLKFLEEKLKFDLILIEERKQLNNGFEQKEKAHLIQIEEKNKLITDLELKNFFNTSNTKNSKDSKLELENVKKQLLQEQENNQKLNSKVNESVLEIQNLKAEKFSLDVKIENVLSERKLERAKDLAAMNVEQENKNTQLVADLKFKLENNEKLLKEATTNFQITKNKDDEEATYLKSEIKRLEERYEDIIVKLKTAGSKKNIEYRMESKTELNDKTKNKKFGELIMIEGEHVFLRNMAINNLKVNILGDNIKDLNSRLKHQNYILKKLTVT